MSEFSDDLSYDLLKLKRYGEVRMLVGYCRTSTAERVASLDAQERDLKAAGAAKMFREQVSSVAPRTQLTACLGSLARGIRLPSRSRIGWPVRRANC